MPLIKCYFNNNDAGLISNILYEYTFIIPNTLIITIIDDYVRTIIASQLYIGLYLVSTEISNII